MKLSVFCSISTGLGVSLMGAVLVITFPILFDVIFKAVNCSNRNVKSDLIDFQLMKVYPGSYSYEIWKDLPIPMYMNVYYWNVTNAKDIIDRKPGVKPKLEEIGPYVFKEKHLKVLETIVILL